MSIDFQKNKQLVLKREELLKSNLDIGGRDIVIGFNEARFRKSNKKVSTPDLDSKLNARFITYFLPAVEVARMQQKRPRLWIASGINVAMKWNANSEEERKIMLVNTKLKFDFLQEFFKSFFSDDFSIIEYVIVQDPLRISDDKILKIWKLLAKEYPKKAEEIKYFLARFKKPNLFNDDKKQFKEDLDSLDEKLLDSFKYAVIHLFVFGDINFKGNYYLNPKGFLSIGGHQEEIFNKVRLLASDIIKKLGDDFFDQEVIMKDNIQLVLKDKERVPPAYNGCYKKTGDKLSLEEVTYENERSLDFYNQHTKLGPQMKYIYDNLISEKDYADFWNEYRKRYIDLKNRYKEAYAINNL